MNSKYDFIECSWSSLKYLFLKYHYLKSMPSGILACYGLFEKQFPFECLGGAVFSNGRIQYDKIYLEFSRMYLVDKLNKNSESWFISKCIKLLKIKFPDYKGIVTWADPSRNHKGTVYLASNFVYDGESRKVKRFKGIGNKIVYQRSSKKGDILLSEDIPKKRFIYYFDSEIREKFKTKNKIKNLNL